MYSFDGFQLRRTDLGDFALAEAWTNADPDHAGKVDPLFWLRQSECDQGYVLSDSQGPLFFFKGVIIGRSMEVHIQFLPCSAEVHEFHELRFRLGNGLMKGMAWLEARMRGVVDQIFFESSSMGLIRFCEKRLGFAMTNGRLLKQITEVKNVRCQ